MTVLVTGGAGYVGSHAVKELQRSGVSCVVLDNLSRGYRELVQDCDIIVGDISDSALVRRVLREHRISAVMHFAAFAYVGESVTKPGLYFRNNVAATLGLLECIVRANVGQFVFSSTCATYGMPEATPIPENHPQRPVNPYGASKLMVERMLADFGTAHGLRSIIFRYFNAAGADPSGTIGEMHEPETHLVPLALQAAAGVGPELEVFGTDYPTADGTCVRDYIHVTDLAQAHVLGLKHLQVGKGSEIFNLGNGAGFSVKEVIAAAERVTGRKVPWKPGPRRAGDPHALVGSAEKARRMLGWNPRFADLSVILETAWKWERSRRR